MTGIPYIYLLLLARGYQSRLILTIAGKWYNDTTQPTRRLKGATICQLDLLS